MLEYDSILIKNNENNSKCLDITYVTKKLLESFKDELLTKEDELLLNLIFSTNPTQEEVDKFLKDWDIEVVGGHKALFLSYFMKEHPNLRFSEYVSPRLKGLMQYYRFHNMKLISAFIKICSEYKKNGINDILILKGGVMKYLRPELSRVMGDIDILVREKDFIKAGKIAEQMGYSADWQLHSIDLHPKGTEEGLLDIHKYIEMKNDNVKFEKSIINDLFKRATKCNVFGLNDILVPSKEDIVFISLVNMVKNLSRKTSSNGILYNLFDCKYLIDLDNNFDWNIVLDNAKKTKTESQLYLAIEFLNNIIPNLLPVKILENKIFEKKFNDYCLLLFYKRFYLWEMKEHSHALKVQDVIKNPRLFKEYMSFKPKYFILKRSIIRKNPYFVKKILKKENVLI